MKERKFRQYVYTVSTDGPENSVCFSSQFYFENVSLPCSIRHYFRPFVNLVKFAHGTKINNSLPPYCIVERLLSVCLVLRVHVFPLN